MVVQGSVDSALAVWEGRAEHAVNVTGGLHHAMPSAASGFCVYNDAAVAIVALLDAGAQRVAYVDIDAHHGDGVQSVFWDDPRVLTVSLHETGHALFPGTGHARETGGLGAEGTAVNVALPSGTGDAGWLRAIDAVVPAVVREFAPGRAGHPARLRHAPARPPHAPAGEPGRPAAGGGAAARARARGGGRSLAGARGRRLRGGRRGAAVVDAPARHRDAPPGRPRHRDPRGVALAGARAVRAAGSGPDDRRPRRDGSARGRAGTTRATTSTAPSGPPARPSSRRSGWTPSTTERAGPHGRRPRRPLFPTRPTGHYADPAPAGWVRGPAARRAERVTT